MLQIVIAVVITLIVTAVLTYFITTAYHKNVANAKIGNAEDRAREIIDEAVKTAETKKREAMLEAKEESIRVKNDLDKEVKERRAEIQRSERSSCLASFRDHWPLSESSLSSRSVFSMVFLPWGSVHPAARITSTTERWTRC